MSHKIIDTPHEWKLYQWNTYEPRISVIYWYQIITPLCGHSAFGTEGAKVLMYLDSSGVKWNFSIKGHRTQTIICHEFCWTFAALKCLNWSNIWIMEFNDLLFYCLFDLKWRPFDWILAVWIEISQWRTIGHRHLSVTSFVEPLPHWTACN